MEADRVDDIYFNCLGKISFDKRLVNFRLKIRSH
jgi:hypothetical protein